MNQKEIQVFSAGPDSAVHLTEAGSALTALVNEGWTIMSSHGDANYLCVILQREATTPTAGDINPTDLSDAD